jgi:hypothetical protein
MRGWPRNSLLRRGGFPVREVIVDNPVFQNPDICFSESGCMTQEQNPGDDEP